MLLRWLPLAAALISSCSEHCKTDKDCGLGAYCAHNFNSREVIPAGACMQDCETGADCAGLELPPGTTPICTNEGRCGAAEVPDRILLRDPETDTVYPSDTTSVRISGELRTSSARVTIAVGISTARGCGGGRAIEPVIIENPTPDRIVHLPFLIDDVPVDPGEATLELVASGERHIDPESAKIRVDCADCPELSVDAIPPEPVPGLELSVLHGTAPPAIDAGIWRVHGSGGVFDGAFSIAAGAFALERLPLFAGINRVELLASDARGSTPWGRCTSWVTSAKDVEHGLRVILQWEGESTDLDVAVVGPGGTFGDPRSTLSAKGASTALGGGVLDSIAGGIAEVAAIGAPADGVYGVIVDARTGGGGGGADARLRVLFDGRLLKRGPIGPAHVSARRGELWMAGKIEVRDGGAMWTDVDRVVLRGAALLDPPESWTHP